MAKVKKEKVKKEKDSGQLVLLVGVVLIICSVILLAISAIMLKSSMSTDKVEEEKEKVMLPLDQVECVETDNIVVILPSNENAEKRMNFTFYVGFALDKNSKDFKKTKTLIEEKNNTLIKARIYKLLTSKYSEDMLKQDSQQSLAEEIFTMMNDEILDTDALAEVYIREFLFR
jgi:flagellar basal body-associated protein FliL